MILYNVTVKINPEIQEDWIRWMKAIHIPAVMNTGIFTEYKICRILQDDSDGYTYAIQYFCPDMPSFERYQRDHAPLLQREHSERYKDQYVAFRTLMEVL